jgi:hypothetical protein
MRLGTRISAIIGVVCTALVIVGVAWAAPVTKVTIRLPTSTHPTLHGSVYSPKPTCRIRTIKVRRQTGPHRSPSTDTVVATTKSHKQDGHGFWQLTAAQEPNSGFYYAGTTHKAGCGRVAYSATVHLLPH